jgi:serine/threonine-protein kinase
MMPSSIDSERESAGRPIGLEHGAPFVAGYRFDRVLGQGGMGIVLAARHEKSKDLVAVKLIRPDRAGDPACVQRFLREGEIARQLESEHVARVLSVGTRESGEPYLIMEYLEGESLESLLHTKGPLAIETAVDYLLQVCEAVAEAHALGIVHRDLKPANLFVTRRSDGSDCVKVLDFGISKWTAGEAAAGVASLTTTASPVGSPRYMSPEQLTRVSSVDARTDIWALGVVLFEFLTGEHPFAAESVAYLCARILRDRPRSLRSIDSAFPSGLDDLCLHCLAKDPARRMPSIGNLAVALAPYATARGRAAIRRIVDVLPAATTTLDGGRGGSGTSAAMRTWGRLAAVSCVVLVVVGSTIQVASRRATAEERLTSPSSTSAPAPPAAPLTPQAFGASSVPAATTDSEAHPQALEKATPPSPLRPLARTPARPFAMVPRSGDVPDASTTPPLASDALAEPAPSTAARDLFDTRL